MNTQLNNTGIDANYAIYEIQGPHAQTMNMRLIARVSRLSTAQSGARAFAMSSGKIHLVRATVACIEMTEEFIRPATVAPANNFEAAIAEQRKIADQKYPNVPFKKAVK